MTDPVLVEAMRASHVESRHRGAVAVVDERGRSVLALGDVDAPVFPRSAVKALQALPLIAAGAEERFGLNSAEIALACASHSGEPAHVRTAAGMLAKVGRDGGCLECGSHWPLDQEALRALAASGGAPSALHNNCSGKHSGFVCLACALDVDPAGYVRPDHAVQRKVSAALAEVTGAAHGEGNRAVDGCSIPTYAVPLRALALGFARFGAGIGLPGDFARAAGRIRAAAAAEPFMVAGTGRLDTRVMEIFRERVFMKTGAEGVYCAALPERGYGIAIKCADGAGRAAGVILATLLRGLLACSDAEAALLDEASRPVSTNWNGIKVGSLRPSAKLERTVLA